MDQVDPYAGLTKHWKNFFNKFNEIDDLDPVYWKEVHLLGHICRRFEQIFGRKFSVTIKSAPSKSPDIRVMKRLLAMLHTTNMKLAKEYVDWVYDTKIIPKNTRFRTVGYFLTSSFVNDFFYARKEKEQIKRSTKLPSSYIELANALGIDDIETYGDLAFVKIACDQNSENSYKRFFDNLEVLGFEENILEEINE